jgi:hypothetical protein
MSKPTKALILRRVEEVVRIRLDGAEYWDVREYVREKEKESGSAWEVHAGGKPLSDASLWRYIARADALAEASARANRKKLLRRHLAQRRNLYAKAVTSGDIRTALTVLKDEAELRGLYPPKRLKVDDGRGKKDDGLSDAERLAALVALHARVGQSDGAAPADRQDVVDGSPLGGPLPGDDAGRPGSGRLAEGSADLGSEPPPAPLFAPGWEESNRRRTGPADGPA